MHLRKNGRKKKRRSQYVVFEFSRVGVFEFATLFLVFFVHSHNPSPIIKVYNSKKIQIFKENTMI